MKKNTFHQILYVLFFLLINNSEAYSIINTSFYSISLDILSFENKKANSKPISRLKVDSNLPNSGASLVGESLKWVEKNKTITVVEGDSGVNSEFIDGLSFYDIDATRITIGGSGNALNINPKITFEITGANSFKSFGGATINTNETTADTNGVSVVASGATLTITGLFLKSLSPTKQIIIDLNVECFACNTPPTDISLTSNSIDSRNASIGASIGNFSTTDADSGDTHTYSLVSGDGDTDNNNFSINGNTLSINSNTLSAGSYNIRVRTTDSSSFFEKTFIINILDTVFPTLSTLTPQDNATDVPLDQNLILVFSEDIKLGFGSFIEIKNSNDDSIFESFSLGADIDGATATPSNGKFGIVNNTVYLNPTNNFKGSTDYYVNINFAFFTDLAGNSYSGISSRTDYNFTTIDPTPPVMESIALVGNPPPSSEEIFYDVTFNKEVTNISLQDFYVRGVSGSGAGMIKSLSDSSGKVIRVAVDIVGAQNNFGGVIRLDFDGTIKDASGNSVTQELKGEEFTLSKVYDTAKEIEYLWRTGDLPENSPIQLTTGSLGLFVPAIAQLYDPDTPIYLKLKMHRYDHVQGYLSDKSSEQKEYTASIYAFDKTTNAFELVFTIQGFLQLNINNGVNSKGDLARSLVGMNFVSVNEIESNIGVINTFLLKFKLQLAAVGLTNSINTVLTNWSYNHRSQPKPVKKLITRPYQYTSPATNFLNLGYNFFTINTDESGEGDYILLESSDTHIISTSDGSEVQLKNIDIAYNEEKIDKLTFKGYKDGESTGEQVISGLSGNFISNKIDLTSYKAFQDIDSLRIEGSSIGLGVAHINSIEFGEEASKPVFSNVTPSANSTFNKALIGYTVSEKLASGSATFTRTGGTPDPNSPYVVNFADFELESVASNIALINQTELVEGAIYTIELNGVDAAGNTAETFTITNTTYDNTGPTFNLTTPTSNSTINSLFFDYSLSEELSKCLVFIRTLNGVDPSLSRSFELTGDELKAGNFAGILKNVPDLVDGALYSFSFIPTDLAGNSGFQILNNVTYEEVNIGFTAASSSGAENVSPANITVNISEANTKTVTVDYTVSGTAQGNGIDYTLADGKLTFAPGTTSRNISIPSIIDDEILEIDETIVITLSNPINATLGTNKTHTYTITNNDTATITIDDISKNENDGDITFTATLDNATAESFTVDVLTSDGTATTADSDYTPLTGTTLNFSGSKGETKTFTLSPTVDTKVEADETLDISINNLQNTTLPIDISDTATATIKNDDEASIAINDVSKAENADGNTTNYTFTTTLKGSVDESFSVDYATLDNTAIIADNDYTATSGTLTFSGIDQETKTFDVIVNNDAKVESDEIYDVFLSNLQSNGKNVKIAKDIGTGTITNDDAATLSINDVTALENADSGATTTFSFTVSLSNEVDESFVVDYATVDDTALAGSDYTATSGTLSFNGTNGESQTILVAVNNDAIVESNETFGVQLSNLQVNGKNVIIPSDTGTGTITNDDSATLSINNVTKIENDDGGATTTFQFTTTLTGSVDDTFTIDYTTQDNTANSNDYTATSGTLSFSGTDSETKTISVIIANDEIVESDEIFNLILSNIQANGKNVTIANNTGTGTIKNDDVTTLTIEDISVAESGIFTLTLTSTNPVDRGFSVNVNTSDGTATISDNDYTGLNSETVSFIGDINEKQTITLTVSDDAKVEADETLALSLSNANANIINPSNIIITDTATVTIEDNDTATLAINDVTILENADGGVTTSFLFTVTLTGDIDQSFTVDYATQDVTAIAGTDYTSTSGTLSFNGTNGETQTFIVSVINDAIVESDETFNVLLSNIQADGKNVTFTDDTAIGTIINDDNTSVTIEDISKSEEETFTVTLTSSAVVDGGFSVEVNTSDISATAGDDYTAITGQTINFTGTALETQTFTITINDDDIVEGIEEIGISISNPTATTVATSTIQITDTGRAVIQDNDTTTITVEDISAPEDGTFILTFTSSNPVDNGFTIDVNTADNTATIADNDYTALTSKTISFSGTKDEQQTITLTVNDDTKVEFDETVDISMNNPTAGTVDITSILISDTTTVTIEDNDAATLAINDVTILENADGGATTNFLFTVTLTGEIDQNFTVDYVTQDDTATAGLDYSATSGTLSFNGTSGETQTLVVSVINDEIVEVDEMFNVSLSNIQADGKNVTFTDDTGVGTITNDDSATLTINDISANEDDGDITVTVTLDKAVQDGFSIDFTTTNGTAIAGTDYNANFGTLSFVGTANETQTFTISPTADTTDENDETINISLSNLNNTSITPIDITDTAVVTLLNDDIPPTVMLSVDNNTIVEKDGNATLTATLSEFSGFDITVNLTYTGAAINGTDYNSSASTTVTIPAGTTTVDFSPIISIIDDDFSENNETIIVDISSIVKGTEDGEQQQTITIIDDDAPFVTSVNVPSPKNYGIGQELDFTVNFNKGVFITGTPRLALTLSTGVVFANYVSGSTSSSLVFKYIVNEGDVDNDGPTLPENIDLNSGSIKDNNSNDAILKLENSEDASLVIIDGIKPTVFVTSTVPDPINTSFIANITFSEAVTDFDINDINLTNATASDFIPASTSEYAVTITPTTDGLVKVSLGTGIAIDLANNPNEASNEYSILYDETQPEVTITSPVPNPTNAIFTVTFTFTEDVFDLDISDIAVNNGVASEFTMISNSVYTAVITPETDGDVIVKLEAGVTEDKATNPNKASNEFRIEYDITPPNPPIITHISEYTCSGNVAVTGDNTIEIFGTSEANSTVDIFLNGDYLATVLQGSGFFNFDYSNTVLADGTYELTAQTTDKAGNIGGFSETFTFTIDTIDTDGDGIADFCDNDDDGNGVADGEEDCDGDGIIDRFDTDNSACSSTFKNTTRYGFSPNGDGVNEAWVIPNILAYPNNVVRVYNRSSKIVFEEKGYKNTWEGVSNKIAGNSLNKKLPVGPYLFVVDLGDGSTPIRGWLYINY